MKRILHFVFFLLVCPVTLFSQITTPVIKARFGVDADLRANYFNGLVQTGNDDWFNLIAADTSGKYVIDTTGVAAVLAGYLTDVSPWPKRMASFFRSMSKPPFSIVNNRLWLDAIFVRDYHGNDTTVFTSGSDKNGMSPDDWTGGIQSIPDKNDILDMFVHIRRAGPNSTDSLWMFGGLSLDNTTGNRYFDFEMYQTDIYYDRVSGNWYGYGPDAGHTSWKFDTSGNITTPGDIIFSAVYQSSTLTNIEARIWVKKTDWQTVVPAAFNWSGQFDGAIAAAQYGYASILPKTAGAFYTGLGCTNNTWAGPFQLVLQNNSLAANYIKDQFMEFSVNLSKLGLDPVGLLGGDVCGTPFNRIVVKTRASASFTAELKDFVAPTDLFLAPRVQVDTDIPMLCDTGGISHIYVINPVATSVYNWSTLNGHIVGSTTGTSITVDTPGIYIVTQYLQAGCSAYATDTIEIGRLVVCNVLENNLVDFRAVLNNNLVRLNWTVLDNRVVSYFDIERSTDAVNFAVLDRVFAQPSHNPVAEYSYTDNISGLATRNVYYRIRMKDSSNSDKYSTIINIPLAVPVRNNVTIMPNPVKDLFQLQISSVNDSPVDIHIYDQTGRIVTVLSMNVQKGNNVFTLDNLLDKPRGVYQAVVSVGAEIFIQKILLIR